jgi:hypothetical protein
MPIHWLMPDRANVQVSLPKQLASSPYRPCPFTLSVPFPVVALTKQQFRRVGCSQQIEGQHCPLSPLLVVLEHVLH